MNSKTATSPSAQPRFNLPYLANTLGGLFGQSVAGVEATPLEGDASTRRYFRLHPHYRSRGRGPDSLMLMQLPEPFPGEKYDFVRIQKFLEGLNVPVPHLYHYDAAKGFVFLQDCGDITLEQQLQNCDEAELRSWYRQAVDMLADMQFRATQRIRPDCPAYHLRFDTAKLMWEMDFMIEHYIEGLLDLKLSDTVWNALRHHLQRLCSELDRQPLHFTHRDFHSRNLMVHDEGLVILDFQDARMGPSQYDLASLLRDSYHVLPEEFVSDMVDRFISLKKQKEKRDVDADEYRRVFDLMSIQRNLKAIGTFAYQKHTVGNGRYEPCIAPTLNYIRTTLKLHDDWKGLRHALESAIPELAA
ncbi:aminoglycoside phosphotransferase family protein [Nitrospina gracilis]|uniref:aminoglycoside phosphotransferase family protein n=1 Tax=Nitrospina gracilis TaxID=35801 RepID=UPI001F1FD09C|nr:phosphotransferase [Nitrospina gracilis]MCF8721598.1 aminoglycoside/choline kinase family phosphotransferase [Nitrospina gracilis Nb-211]